MQGVLNYRGRVEGGLGEEGCKKIGFLCYGRSSADLLGALALERCVVFGKNGPLVVGPNAVSPCKTHGFWRARVWSCFSKGPQKRVGVLLRPLGLPRATFKATTQNTVFCRDWRSVCGPFWPKWAWHSRGVHILKKPVFTGFRKSTLSVVFRVPLGAPGPLRAPSGGPRGPNDQT